MFDHQFEFSCRQLTNIDSETERKWKFGVRSKYIVRPWAVEEVLIVFYTLFYSGGIMLAATFISSILSIRLECTV